ncbi:SprT-like family [Singulisphaera acidiphila]|uniref:SprT-like family n=1 Tax=Singulisphaera acidiphila (strain ATCC BAA-1392 / DSM 18658 / VKM B-2454 / MOB10) TaxID=886293 RepID=L0DEG1_SINAD|nr:SprT-like family [Singulisphaera acidiphila]AGA27046.1 SprT-like family [Singulisphaera acidiphila DSM 18658]
MDRPACLMSLHLTADEVALRNGHIYEEILRRSEQVRTGNFIVLGTADLHLLFGLYDARFFDGLLRRMLREDGAGEVALRLSARMTRSAGKTYMRRERRRTPAGVIERVEYEIAVSTLLLFQNFQEPGRPVSVGGLVCRDWLEVLQRIFEHELLHLAEFLAWGRSSCAAANFHALSRRIFGHEGATHDLVTPRELAAEVYQVRVGDRVSFEHEGRRWVGRVNRITRRATVLVEDLQGSLYSDGRRYMTFYVPVPSLCKEIGLGKRG